MGSYNYGKKRERGETLIRFCMENELKIVNTLFKKRKRSCWTWVISNEEIGNQTDYILATKYENKIKDFKILNNFELYSDCGL